MKSARTLVFIVLILFFLPHRPLAAEESIAVSSSPVVAPSNAAAIQWFEWGTNAFQLAQKENKPILLYLTSSWCHWCQVMDTETFTDPDIIDRINHTFVPVKVDTDLRPDLNARYNTGGWPSTVFLTSDGFILAGAAYLSPLEMKSALPEIERLHRDKRKEFNDKSLNDMAEFDALLSREIQSAKDEELAPSFIDKILAGLLIGADDELGGIGKEDKNPIPEVTEFLYLVQEVKPDVKAGKILERFLTGQAKLFDPEMGGFYRYATKRDWTEPQFEKMLGVNAFLIRDFVWSRGIFDRPKDKEMVSATINYVQDTLLDKALGGFFGSQAADYALITSGLDQKEESAIIPGTVYYSYPKQKRLELGVPPVDRHVYADTSAQMVSALITEAQKMNDEKTGGVALRAIDFLMDVSFDRESGMKHVFPEPEHSLEMLADQVYVLKALLDAYEFSQDVKYLSWANDLFAITEKNLGTGQGIFYDMAQDTGAIANLKKREIPLIENCLMARQYIRLGALTGQEIYRQKAKAILSFFAPRYQQFSFFAAAYGSALTDWFYPAIDAKIIGKRNDPKATVLFEELVKLSTNRLHIRWEDSVKEEAPKVMICVAKECLTPVDTPDKITILYEVASKMVQSKS
ncbi:MAG: thioredoxin domain-containing protein [Candidatus Omnitrophica bacterium]|nr:thioredoxin domain-containing protein [Candidatus Omnitrophota bacterium]